MLYRRSKPTLHIMGLASLHMTQTQTWSSSMRGRRTETVEARICCTGHRNVGDGFGRYLNIGLNSRAKPSEGYS